MKTSAAPCPGIRNPIVVYLMSRIQRVSPFYRIAHASSTLPLRFCHHSFWTFCEAVHQPDNVHASTFLQICNHSWSCRTSAFVNFTHVGLVSVCLSSSVKSMKTSAAPCPGIRNPIVVYLMSRIQRVSPFYRIAHASSTLPLHFCHHSFWTFCEAVHQPDNVHASTFRQICNHPWSCGTSILEGATFHRMNWCKFL